MNRLTKQKDLEGKELTPCTLCVICDKCDKSKDDCWELAMYHKLIAYEDAEKQGRLHITKVGIGGKLYEPNEYGDIYEWNVVSVGIGGCVGEDYLCDRDDGTDVHTFDYGDIGNGVYVTREEAEKAQEDNAE